MKEFQYLLCNQQISHDSHDVWRWEDKEYFSVKFYYEKLLVKEEPAFPDISLWIPSIPTTKRSLFFHLVSFERGDFDSREFEKDYPCWLVLICKDSVKDVNHLLLRTSYLWW